MRLLKRFLPVTLCLLALAFTTTPALATRNHVFSPSGSFGSKGPGAGQLELATPVFSHEGVLESPGSGVAVNNATHDVYVADTGNRRVDEFSSTGVFILAFGKEVDQTTKGDVCTVASHDTCVAGTSGSAAGQFVSPTFVAVDNSPGGEGDVYVGDSGNDLVSKFTAEGVLVAGWGDNGASEAANGQLAGKPAEPLGCVAPEEPCSAAVHFAGILGGIAVDATGDLWVHDETTMFEFSQTGTFAQSWGAGGVPAGLAIDGSGDLYFAVGEPNAALYTPAGSLTGNLFPIVPAGSPPRSFTALAFDSASERLYLDDGGNSIHAVAGGCPPPNRECTVIESFGSAQLAGQGGQIAVDPGSASEPVYVADAAAGRVDTFILEQPGAPTVESESVSEVSGDSASFSGQIDPRGGPTEYRLEYGPCSSASACATSGYGHSVPVPDGFVGSDFEPHPVGPLGVHELLASTVYHYRIVAHNVMGGEVHTTLGEEKIFTTQAAGGEFVLPDGRGWELVSPPDKHGAQLASREEGVIQAAAGGGSMTYPASTPTESMPKSYPESVQVFSTRGGGGWSSVDIEPPSNPVVAQGTSVGAGSQYRFFSEDLLSGVVQPFGAFTPCRSAQGAVQPCLSEEATEQTAFLRDSTTGIYTPLVTRSNDTASPFVPFGEEPVCAAGVGGEAQHHVCGPQFVGASADARHIVLQGKVPLTAGSPPASLPCGSGAPLPCLYEWGAGTLSFIGNGFLGHKGESARGAVSDDGSRVVFEGASEGVEGLLLRDTVAGKAWRLDAREPACAEPECESGGGRFQIASHDGSLVFFTSDRRLTKDAGADVGHGKPDLYVYDVNAPEGHRLTDLTPLGQGSEAAGVHGVLGASEDGSAVYFVANGVQGENPGAVHGTCAQFEKQSSGDPGHVCNLYVVRREAGGWGQPRLIAVLSEADYPDWAERLEHQTSRVAPDGQWLAFQSQRPLTGYDSRDVLTGKPDEEVYLYDAATGGLACASCNPTGARPTGGEAGNGQATWVPSAGLAGTVPGWDRYEGRRPRYQPRYLSDQGRLFFNSSDALVPGDVNGQQDVYEYEPQGLGGCSSAPAGSGVVFKPGAAFKDETREGAEDAGCVGLISSGRSSEGSEFLDASVSGADVFFKTAAKLAPQDFDTSADFYDAHICTSESPCTSAPTTPAPCTTESSCKASPTPQPGIFGAPASATFSGLGNAGPQPAGKPSTSIPCSSSKGTPAKACTRAQNLKKALATCKRKYPHSKKRRGGCEAGARKRYGAKKAKKAKRQ